MPKIDELKENIAMLKVWLGVIAGVFVALSGWLLNKLEISENTLMILAFCVLVLLVIATFFIIRRINAIIKEVGKLKK